jgi:hypothetical protein
MHVLPQDFQRPATTGFARANPAPGISRLGGPTIGFALEGCDAAGERVSGAWWCCCFGGLPVVAEVVFD